MLHKEESRPYEIHNPPKIDFEIQLQIAAQIFSTFVSLYGQEMQPDRGGLYVLAEQACDYARLLPSILIDQKIEEEKKENGLDS